MVGELYQALRSRVTQAHDDAAEPLNLASLSTRLCADLGSGISGSNWFGFGSVTRAVHSLGLPNLRVSQHFMLASAVADYFTLPQPAPLMSIASGVTELTRDQIPTIVHVNDTARVQTVAPESNYFLAEVLTEFAAITGHPVLINTSLNIKGKPICGT